jgi:hypothetical protein
LMGSKSNLRMHIEPFVGCHERRATATRKCSPSHERTTVSRRDRAGAQRLRVEARDPSAESFITLARRAVRAGNKELALLVLRRGRERASPEDQPLLTQAARELGLE